VSTIRGIFASWDSSITVLAGYRLGDQVSIPGRGRHFSIHHHAHSSYGNNTDSYQVVPEAFLPGVEQQICEIDHSPPSTANINNV